jgi:hypothetical protein
MLPRLGGQRGDERQRAAALELARAGPQPAHPGDRGGVERADQRAAAGRHHQVPGPGQPAQRVDDDDRVAAALGGALAALDQHLDELDVARGRLAEGRHRDVAAQAAAQLGGVLGAHVDRDQRDLGVGVVLDQRPGQLPEQRALAGARRRLDQDPLAPAERRVQLAGPHRRRRAVEAQPLARRHRRAIVEVDPLRVLIGGATLDRLDAQQREVALALLGGADGAADDVAGAQPEAADLRRRHVDVVDARRELGVGVAQEAEAVGQHLEDALGVGLAAAIGVGLEHRQHQVGLAQLAGVVDAELLGGGAQLVLRHPPQRAELERWAERAGGRSRRGGRTGACARSRSRARGCCPAKDTGTAGPRRRRPHGPRRPCPAAGRTSAACAARAPGCPACGRAAAAAGWAPR